MKQYYKGHGFGLGGSICIDENVGLSNSREGDFGWGGAASTAFYISDKFDYSLVFLTQVLESEETRKLNSEIKKLVNGCVDVHKNNLKILIVAMVTFSILVLVTELTG